MKNKLTLGSLFDGSGACPLAAVICGIEPIWASEIESFPVQVTSKRFPKMKHLGDITKINGAKIDPVDIITFGSPCQDLSVAGRRAGLGGEKSNLFMQAIRIIREMREATNNEYPRFIMWENVPGAFSSNKGLDFRTVLEEIAQADIPMPDGGKWAKAGMAELPECQIAWRVLDAQYWGVPQRRKRIFLVADFRGKCAAEILFKPESVSGYFAQGENEGQGVAAATKRSIGAAGFIGKASPCAGSIGYQLEQSPTLRAGQQMNVLAAPFDTTQVTSKQNASRVEYGLPCHTLNANAHIPAVIYGICSFHSNSMLSDNPHSGVYEAETSRTLDCNAGNPACNQGGIAIVEKDVAGLDCRSGRENGNFCGTLQAKPNGGFSYNCTHPVRIGRKVRRLTPTECARLQGFPDGWCADIPHSDTAEYKMWGNGMALPCVLYIMQNIAEVLT